QLRSVADLRHLGQDRYAQPSKVVAALAADRVEHDVALADIAEPYPKGVDVQPPGQPAIGRDKDQQPLLHRPFDEEGMLVSGLALGGATCRLQRTLALWWLLRLRGGFLVGSLNQRARLLELVDRPAQQLLRIR